MRTMEVPLFIPSTVKSRGCDELEDAKWASLNAMCGAVAGAIAVDVDVDADADADVDVDVDVDVEARDAQPGGIFCSS